jgi:hypothetical protein
LAQKVNIKRKNDIKNIENDFDWLKNGCGEALEYRSTQTLTVRLDYTSSQATCCDSRLVQLFSPTP